MTARRKLVPGLYEDLVDAELDRRLAALAGEAKQIDEDLEPARTAEAFARYLYLQSRVVLGRLGEVEEQRALVDALLERLGLDVMAAPTRKLLAIADPDRAGLAAGIFPPRPLLPLDESDLLVNARGQTNLGQALLAELPSADGVDLICSFIRRTGLARLQPALRELSERRPGRLRVLTTTYTGVTEGEALARLADLGADVRVDYGGQSTRLHAKTWILHRHSGLSTAYVGSSNISHAALVDGREWNVRLSARENPDLLRRLAAEFEVLWLGEDFSAFERERFERARARQRHGDDGTPIFVGFDLRPYDYQERILEQLAAARELHGHHRNLVVAATGTGKTMIAAFDYARMRGASPRLLFVAHRKEILAQALATFRAVLREPHFGELLVDGHRPTQARHVFASIQSLHQRIDELDPHDYDFVIVDEFHHAEAPTYQRLLSRLEPRELLGLTATPERGDGRDPTRWFGGRITAELRLWEALERGLLCPFHYYGVSDDVDLAGLEWRQGGYERGTLEALYTGNHARVRRLLAAIPEYVPNPESMRALGFCVGVAHARFMAAQFQAHGVAAAAVVGEDGASEREQALLRLRRGELRVLFCVDVFNEGVDLPEVDTLLFLRPTESATLFLQQLGRGLRLSPGKLTTTVLDLIGNAHRNFRFDRRFRALLSESGGAVVKQIGDDFPYLPPGCAIVLEPQARSIVLDNVARALSTRRAALLAEVRAQAEGGEGGGVGGFLTAMQWQPEQLYRQRSADWTYTALQRDAGVVAAAEFDDKIGRSLAGALHVDDPLRLQTWLRWLGSPRPPVLTGMGPLERRLATMLLTLLLSGAVGKIPSLAAGLRRVWAATGLRVEARDLMSWLAERVDHLAAAPEQDLGPVPLRVHARYSRDELLAACGVLEAGKDPRMQTGIRVLTEAKLILNLVTIDKQIGYSPKTQYRDYALSRTRFHSESPHTAGPDTKLGRWLIEHRARGMTVLLFVRPRKHDERGLPMPYLFLGSTALREWSGDRPMQLTWELGRPLPAWFYPQACLGG